jgi:hypothetical protein
VLLAVVMLGGCARAAVLQPITGERVPAAQLPAGRLLVDRGTVHFTWEFLDDELAARGDGVARIAAPDSARLDFFLAGGFGGGRAVLIGESLRIPPVAGASLMRRIVPPTPLLWAAVGRLALPPLPDTAAARDGATIRADIGRPPEWRVTFMGDSLTRLERVSGGRVVEWVERSAGGVRYRSESARRELRLRIDRTEATHHFDEAIWNP